MSAALNAFQRVRPKATAPASPPTPQQSNVVAPHVMTVLRAEHHPLTAREIAQRSGLHVKKVACAMTALLRSQQVRVAGQVLTSGRYATRTYVLRRSDA